MIGVGVCNQTNKIYKILKLNICIYFIINSTNWYIHIHHIHNQTIYNKIYYIYNSYIPTIYYLNILKLYSSYQHTQLTPHNQTPCPTRNGIYPKKYLGLPYPAMPNSKASLFPFSCNLTILNLLYTFSPSLLPPPLPLTSPRECHGTEIYPPQKNPDRIGSLSHRAGTYSALQQLLLLLLYYATRQCLRTPCLSVRPCRSFVL